MSQWQRGSRHVRHDRVCIRYAKQRRAFLSLECLEFYKYRYSEKEQCTEEIVESVTNVEVLQIENEDGDVGFIGADKAQDFVNQMSEEDYLKLLYN